MRKSRLVPFILAVLFLPPLLAQRVVSTVSPPEGEEIRFDVNDFPLTNLPASSPPPGVPVELNFGPNIVFTPDSSRAFVSYPGSDKVMAFDPATAEVLALIPVGINPGLLTLTPDGTQLGVVSLFLRANIPAPEDGFQSALIGSISMIDVETFAVRTLDLENVFFSVANNIVFSPDGTVGYVASAGTDDLIRFDVASLTEITPRLEFEGGTRPASITPAPDFSYLAVVLVGSSALVQLETPDSIQLVDPATFRVSRAIVPPPLEIMRNDGSVVRVPHNFFATNSLAISSDGKFGLIGDRENSAGSLAPELASDHALLIEMEPGTVRNVIGIGGLPGGAAYNAQLGVFAILSAFSASFINPVAENIVTAGSASSQFRESTRPVFAADGRRALLPSPVIDLLSVVDARTGGVRNLVVTGRDFDSESPFIPAGTLEAVVSPNGQILAALNFNANTIDLLKNTLRFAIPEFLSTAEWFTGVAITNTSATPAEIVAGGVAPTGLPYSDDPETEEVVEAVNPKTLTLEAGHQISFTAGDLLETSLTLEGWLDLDSDATGISSFFLTGDFAGRRLDGGISTPDIAQTIVIPGVGIDRGFQTVITVVNTNLSTSGIDIDLLDSEGTALARVSQNLLSSAVFTRFLVDPDTTDTVENGLFPEAMFEENQPHYLRISSQQGVIAYVRYFDEERMASMNAIAVSGPDIQLPTTLYAPQAAVFGGTDSRLALVNTAAETAMVAVTLRGDAGEALAGPVQIEIEAGHSLASSLAELLQLEDPGFAVSGWLEVSSDRVGVVGSLELQIFSGRAMSVIPLQLAPAPGFVFAHVAEGFGFATGLSLVNPAQESAMVRVRVHRPDGSAAGEAEFELGPGGRQIGLLRQLIPGLPEMAGGYIRIESSRPLVGLELFYTENQETLAAVPPQVPLSP